MSIFSDLGDALLGVAPTLAKTALTIATGGTINPLVLGVASEGLSAILGGLGGKQPDKQPELEDLAGLVLKSLSGGINPTQAEMIKQIEDRIRKEHADKGIDLDTIVEKEYTKRLDIARKDRQGARKLAEKIGLTPMHYVIVIGIVLGLVASATIGAVYGKGNDAQWIATTMSMLVAAFLREFHSVCSFLFGSSAGSKMKDGGKDE